MELKDELMTVLTAPTSGLKTPELSLEKIPGGRVGGFVVSPTFFHKPQIERQNILWDYLEATLTPGKLRKIAMLITVTPAEFRLQHRRA